MIKLKQLSDLRLKLEITGKVFLVILILSLFTFYWSSVLKKTTFSATLHHFHNKLWSFYLFIPKELGDPFVDGTNRRVVCYLGDEPPIHAALMPKGDGYSIYVTKKLQQKLGVEEGGEITVSLEKDESQYGLPMPESLEAMILQDDEGRAYFERLTMGKQRSLIYIVSKVKSVDKQITKALAIIDHLKEARGQLDFKQLNERIKAYNNRQL